MKRNRIAIGLLLFALPIIGYCFENEGLFKLGTTRDAAMDALLLQPAEEHGVFIAVGANGRYMVSKDGTTWDTDQTIGYFNLNGVAYGDNTVVAVGDNGKVISTNGGETWEITGKNNDRLKDVAYGNGRFIAVGEKGRRVVSRDGRIWTNDKLSGNDLNAITYYKQQFTAAGWQTRISITDKGTIWDEFKADTSPNSKVRLNSILYANASYTTVGDAGFIANSVDGRVWANIMKNNGVNLFGITYGNGRYVAVGEYGRTVISYDGVFWQNDTRTNSLNNSLESVAFGHGQFVAVGLGGRILNSTDGITWTTVNSTGDDLHAIVYAPSDPSSTGDAPEVCHTHWHRHDFPITDGKNGMHRHWHCHPQTERKDIHNHTH